MTNGCKRRWHKRITDERYKATYERLRDKELAQAAKREELESKHVNALRQLRVADIERTQALADELHEQREHFKQYEVLKNQSTYGFLQARKERVESAMKMITDE